MDANQALKARVCTLMADILAVDEAAITDAATFDDLGVDSLTAAQLLSAVEDEFGITIEDEAIPTIISFPSLIEAIAQAGGHA